jgi:hypothetical protein
VPRRADVEGDAAQCPCPLGLSLSSRPDR